MPNLNNRKKWKRFKIVCFVLALVAVLAKIDVYLKVQSRAVVKEKPKPRWRTFFKRKPIKPVETPPPWTAVARTWAFKFLGWTSMLALAAVLISAISGLGLVVVASRQELWDMAAALAIIMASRINMLTKQITTELIAAARDNVGDRMSQFTFVVFCYGLFSFLQSPSLGQGVGLSTCILIGINWLLQKAAQQQLETSRDLSLTREKEAAAAALAHVTAELQAVEARATEAAEAAACELSAAKAAAEATMEAAVAEAAAAAADEVAMAASEAVAVLKKARDADAVKIRGLQADLTAARSAMTAEDQALAEMKREASEASDKTAALEKALKAHKEAASAAMDRKTLLERECDAKARRILEAEAEAAKASASLADAEARAAAAEKKVETLTASAESARAGEEKARLAAKTAEEQVMNGFLEAGQAKEEAEGTIRDLRAALASAQQQQQQQQQRQQTPISSDETDTTSGKAEAAVATATAAAPVHSSSSSPTPASPPPPLPKRSERGRTGASVNLTNDEAANGLEQKEEMSHDDPDPATGMSNDTTSQSGRRSQTMDRPVVEDGGARAFPASFFATVGSGAADCEADERGESVPRARDVTALSSSSSSSSSSSNKSEQLGAFVMDAVFDGFNYSGPVAEEPIEGDGGDSKQGEKAKAPDGGSGVATFPATGNRYVGDFHKGRRHGRGTFFWAHDQAPRDMDGTQGAADVSQFNMDIAVGEGARWNKDRTKAWRLRDGKIVSVHVPVETKKKRSLLFGSSSSGSFGSSSSNKKAAEEISLDEASKIAARLNQPVPARQVSDEQMSSKLKGYTFHYTGPVVEGGASDDSSSSSSSSSHSQLTPHGHGLMRFGNGDEFAGDFVRGKRHGVGTYRYAKSGNAEVGRYEGDSVVGDGARWTADRKVACLLVNGNRSAASKVPATAKQEKQKGSGLSGGGGGGGVLTLAEAAAIAARLGLGVPPPHKKTRGKA